jgi:uncharacterized membrane protein
VKIGSSDTVDSEHEEIDHLIHHAGAYGYFPLGLLGLLAGLLLLAGLVLGIVWLVRTMAGPSTWRPPLAGPAQPPAGTPLDILARRFASGEIGAEEYQKARDVLRETPAP